MLRDDLQKALKEAMLAKDTLTTSAVRMIIAGQKEKDVEARGKGQEKATDAELMSMMQGMIKQRNDSIKMFLEGNRPELAEKQIRHRQKAATGMEIGSMDINHSYGSGCGRA